MDAHVKEGQLYAQHQKFGKKWKKNWFVLYPASQNGIARLECYDSPPGAAGGGGAGGGSGGGANERTRRLDKKIIRLSDCISILPAVMETCPKDNMTAFCVETNDKTHVFAAERLVCMEWVEKMCEIAFQGGSGSAPSCAAAAADTNGKKKELQMSENLIYSSRDEVNAFWVSVQRTEASDRCGLAGSYWLKAELEALVLRDPKTKNGVLLWPYKLLRRYGRDRVMFSFEAGRRCESGPGKFTFDTKQGNDIFQLVEQAIQSQKALAGPGSAPPDPDVPPFLQHLWALPVGAGSGSGSGSGTGPGDNGSSRESDGDSGGSKPGSADGVLGRYDGADGAVAKGGGGGSKGRSLPEPPPTRVPLGHRQGSTTTSSSSSASSDDHTSFYSEPVDSLRLQPPPPRADSFYSDPISVLMGQTPPAAPAPPGGLYFCLYDQAALDLGHKAAALALDDGGGGSNGGSSSSSASSHPTAHAGEHIYDEPEGRDKGRGSVATDDNVYDTAGPAGPAGLWGGPRGPKAPGVLLKPPRPKPSLAPKPSRLVELPSWKEPLPPPPLKPWDMFLGKNNRNNNNNNNNNDNGNIGVGGSGVLVRGAGSELYSTVSKQRPPSPGLWLEQHAAAAAAHRHTHQPPPLRAPDLIYDNLGDV